MIHLRHKRYFGQILSFGVIWLLFGLLYARIEQRLPGRLSFYPTTGNRCDFPISLVYTGSSSFIMGIIQGWIEVVWFRKRFEKRALWVKMLLKGLLYLLLIICFLIILTLVINARRLNSSPFSSEVIDSVVLFFGHFSFWSIVGYGTAILAIALFFSEIGQCPDLRRFGNYIIEECLLRASKDRCTYPTG